MKRFLFLILGATLLAAAPASAQQPGPSGADHAAALLRKAQEAAAQGNAQQAADLARAAAELFAAQQAAHAEARAGAVRAHAAKAAALPHVEHAEVREHAEFLEVRERHAQAAAERELAAAAAHAGAPSGVRIIRAPRADRVQEPAGPDAPSFFRMREAPEGGRRRAQDEAPRAPEREELGLTLKLIHAEVQALRAEVQALRTEISLMRMRGGVSHAAPGAAWSPESDGGQRRIIIIGPDGKRMETSGPFGHGGAWTMEVPGIDEVEDEAVLLEDVLEELNGLGYVDTGAHAPDGHVMHGDFQAINRWHSESDGQQPDTRARLNFQFNTTPAPAAVAPTPSVPAVPAVPGVPSAPARPRAPR